VTRPAVGLAVCSLVAALATVVAREGAVFAVVCADLLAVEALGGNAYCL